MARPTLGIRAVEHLCSLLGTSRSWLDRYVAAPGRHVDRRARQVGGKVRRLAVPRPRLRAVLDRLQERLQGLALPDAIHGARRGRSVVTNARVHCGKPVVVRLDIRDFFPNVSHRRVYGVFREAQRCSPDVARYLTRLTTLDGALPQGFPTSPMIANLVIAALAARLERLAARHGADYTQYLDDITLSGPAHLERLVPLLERIIRQEGFEPNFEKTCVLPAGAEQVVTGVRVDQGPAAPTAKLAEVADLLGRVPGAEAPDLARLRGKLAYIRHIDPRAGSDLTRRLDQALQAADDGRAGAMALRRDGR